jgi:hypothetical protein
MARAGGTPQAVTAACDAILEAIVARAADGSAEDVRTLAIAYGLLIDKARRREVPHDPPVIRDGR